MPIKQETILTNPTGEPVVPFDDWIETLPEDQRAELLIARADHQRIRQKYIDAGILTIVPDTGTLVQIWNVDIPMSEREVNETWGYYVARYQEETNTIAELAITEI